MTDTTVELLPVSDDKKLENFKMDEALKSTLLLTTWSCFDGKHCWLLSHALSTRV